MRITRSTNPTVKSTPPSSPRTAASRSAPGSLTCRPEATRSQRREVSTARSAISVSSAIRAVGERSASVVAELVTGVLVTALLVAAGLVTAALVTAGPAVSEPVVGRVVGVRVCMVLSSAASSVKLSEPDPR